MTTTKRKTKHFRWTPVPLFGNPTAQRVCECSTSRSNSEPRCTFLTIIVHVHQLRGRTGDLFNNSWVCDVLWTCFFPERRTFSRLWPCSLCVRVCVAAQVWLWQKETGLAADDGDSCNPAEQTNTVFIIHPSALNRKNAKHSPYLNRKSPPRKSPRALALALAGHRLACKVTFDQSVTCLVSCFCAIIVHERLPKVFCHTSKRYK